MFSFLVRLPRVLAESLFPNLKYSCIHSERMKFFLNIRAADTLGSLARKENHFLFTKSMENIFTNLKFICIHAERIKLLVKH
jgi:hypothetical protein